MIDDKDTATDCLKNIAIILLKENRFIEANAILETLIYFYKELKEGVKK